MPRIIVEYPDECSAVLALSYATRAIHGGKVSEANGVAHYCWATRFHRNGICGGGEALVYTRRKKTEKSADSLIVMFEKGDS